MQCSHKLTSVQVNRSLGDGQSSCSLDGYKIIIIISLSLKNYLSLNMALYIYIFYVISFYLGVKMNTKYFKLHGYMHWLEVCGGTVRIYEPFKNDFFFKNDLFTEPLSAKAFKRLLKSVTVYF